MSSVKERSQCREGNGEQRDQLFSGRGKPKRTTFCLSKCRVSSVVAGMSDIECDYGNEGRVLTWRTVRGRIDNLKDVRHCGI